jgi:hypothetical protein
MTDRELMQQAADKLSIMVGYPGLRLYHEDIRAVMNALRERLAQPEQEPVLLNNGRLTQYSDGRIGVGTPAEQELVIDCPRCGHCCPQRKPLTDEEIEVLAKKHNGMYYDCDITFARAIEAKLKEKNNG